MDSTGVKRDKRREREGESCTDLSAERKYALVLKLLSGLAKQKNYAKLSLDNSYPENRKGHVDVSVIDTDIGDHQNEPINESPKHVMWIVHVKFYGVSNRTTFVRSIHSELNKLKGSPIYYEPDNEEKVSDSDVELLDDRKRKRQDSPDGAEDKSPLPTPIMGVDPHDLVDKICNDIMSINDVDSLEKEWVRSSKPHPIGLSLRRIQGILCRDQPLDVDCFNMAIRILACDKDLLAVDPPTTVTEAALASARNLDSRVQRDIQALAALLRSWTEIERNISSCNLVRYKSGYFVFHFMLSWYGNKFVRPICTDGYELRKNFLIYLLDYNANGAEENIPYDIRQILKCLK
ncbi:hypothetical protein D1007_51569 [Hordeum vulgare]|nr:hypothetical protein D1007_51569 [Hordeum vulgare]